LDIPSPRRLSTILLRLQPVSQESSSSPPSPTYNPETTGTCLRHSPNIVNVCLSSLTPICL
jgi:hypothetical protein